MELLINDTGNLIRFLNQVFVKICFFLRQNMSTFRFFLKLLFNWLKFIQTYLHYYSNLFKLWVKVKWNYLLMIQAIWSDLVIDPELIS